MVVCTGSGLEIMCGGDDGMCVFMCLFLCSGDGDVDISICIVVCVYGFKFRFIV